MTDAVKKEIWVTFAGVLDTANTRAMFHFFSNAIREGVDIVHFLIHSPGGNVNDGVALFNYFNTLPINLIDRLQHRIRGKRCCACIPWSAQAHRV